jgi:hypothetical protein
MTADIKQAPLLRTSTATMRRITLALAALLLVVGLIAFRYKAYDPTRWTYRSHQRELTAIVAQIKAQQIPIGTERAFEVARSLDPATLSPCKKSADHASLYHILANRNDQDDYLITIVIDEEGHAGRYGLLYSDLPLKMVSLPDSDGVSIDGAAELPCLKECLSSQWSYVFEGG